MDFKTKRNRGYGFINFESADIAKQQPGGRYDRACHTVRPWVTPDRWNQEDVKEVLQHKSLDQTAF